MVARADGVLIGLAGILTVFLGLQFRGIVGLTMSGIGIGLVAAGVLYAVAGSSAWSESRRSRKHPWVTLACPLCGTPLGWVDEVGQWYCPECEVYLQRSPIKIPLVLAR